MQKYNTMCSEHEDLNINRAIDKIINYCWFNKDKFPTVKEIAEVTGLKERTVYSKAKKNRLPKRDKIIKPI